MKSLARRNQKYYYVQLAYVTLFAMVSWLFVTSIFGNQGFGDSGRYMAIAQDPFTLTESPWAYRIAVPWIVAGLAEVSGFSLDAIFQALQFTSYLLCLLLIQHVALTLNSKRIVLLVCPALFTVGYQFVYYRHNYVHIGMLEIFLLGYLVWLLYREKWMAVLVVLSLSILVKESVAFVFLQTIFVYYFVELFISKRLIMSVRQLLVVCATPLVIFVSVRLLFTSTEKTGAESYLSGYSQEFFEKVFNGDFLGRGVDYFTVAGVLLYLVPISLIYFRRDKILRINLLVVVFSSTQLLLATDSKRMACMSIVSLIFMLITLQKYARERVKIVLIALLHVVYAAGWLSQNYWLAVIALLLGALVLVFGAEDRPVGKRLKQLIQ